MRELELKNILNTNRISITQRDALVDTIIKNTELFTTLWELVLQEDQTDRWHCSWVFDNVLRKNLNLLIPILPSFTENISKLNSESVIRPVAHSCELVAKALYLKKNSSLILAITHTHKEILIESCFTKIFHNTAI